MPINGDNIPPLCSLPSLSRNIFGQIFGHQKAEIEAKNTKMTRGQQTHPIRVNARYEINWANSFFKKFWKPCLQMNGLTDRHQGESSIPVFYLWWSRAIVTHCATRKLTLWKHLTKKLISQNTLNFFPWARYMMFPWEFSRKYALL